MIKSILGKFPRGALQCKQVALLSTAYLDGTLHPDRISLVREHLGICQACSLQLAEEKQIRDGLGQLESVEPPANLWANVRYQLRCEQQTAQPWMRWGNAVGGLGVALAIVLLVAVRIVSNGAGPGATTHKHISAQNDLMEPPCADLKTYQQSWVCDNQQVDNTFEQVAWELEQLMEKKDSTQRTNKLITSSFTFEQRMQNFAAFDDHSIAMPCGLCSGRK